MRIREQWDKRDTGIGFKAVAILTTLFVAGVGTLLYFVAPEMAQQTVTDAWDKMKRTHLTTAPTTRPTEIAPTLPATRPAISQPVAAVIPPFVPATPPAPPKPKPVLVKDGAKDKKTPVAPGWRTGFGGMPSLVMEGPKKKPTTRPTEKSTAAMKGLDTRTAAAYSGRSDPLQRADELRRPERRPTRPDDGRGN